MAPPTNKWTANEEVQLFLALTEDYTFPPKAWQKAATKLGRTVCGIRQHYDIMKKKIQKNSEESITSDSDGSSPEPPPLAPRTTGRLKPIHKPVRTLTQKVKTEASARVRVNTPTEPATRKRQAVIESIEDGLPEDERSQLSVGVNLKRKHKHSASTNRNSATNGKRRAVEVAKEKQRTRVPIIILDSEDEQVYDAGKRARVRAVTNPDNRIQNQSNLSNEDARNSTTDKNIDREAVRSAFLHKRLDDLIESTKSQSMDEMLTSMESGNTQTIHKAPAVLQRKVKHGFQDYDSNSGDMISEPQKYASPRHDPISLRYVPSSSGCKPTSPRYVPNSPGYAPISSRYVPTSPVYAPISNSSSGERTLEDQSEQDNTYRSDEVNQNVGLNEHDSIDLHDGIDQHNGINQHDGINQRDSQHNGQFRGATTEKSAYVDSVSQPANYLLDRDRVYTTTELQNVIQPKSTTKPTLPIFHEDEDDDESGMYEAEDFV